MTTSISAPRISVVIPTRERADVLQSSLRTVTQQDYENLEILVSDNFSGDRTREIVLDIADPRIKYVNTGQRVSMSHNWEFALSHVTGDWVTIIGDDDGLIPDCLPRVAALIQQNSVSAIQSTTCLYRWPGHKSRSHGRIRVALGTKIESRESATWIRCAMHGSATHQDLPTLYTGGFVKASVIEGIKKIIGRVYNSRIPDVYSAFAIASLVPHYVFSHSPLAIAGISRYSTGTDEFSNLPKSADSPSRTFSSENNLPFHIDLPLLEDGKMPSSLSILNLESYWQSAPLRISGDKISAQQHLDVILATTDLNTPGLLSWCRAFAEMHHASLEDGLKNSRRLRAKMLIPRIVKNFQRRMARHTIGSPQLPLMNVYDASVAAEAYLKTRNLRPPI